MMSEIVLVQMPFGALERPSLGIGLLVAAAKKEGLHARAFYPLFRFAETIGYQSYNLIAQLLNAEYLLSEWIFSNTEKSDEFLDYIFKPEHPVYRFVDKMYHKNAETFRADLEGYKKFADSFILDTAKEIVAQKPKIVGCSASIMQYNASVRLLAEIKKINSDIFTLLGGAQCEAEMGYITKKKFKCLDVVVSGEADILFPLLCKQLLKNNTLLIPDDYKKAVFSSYTPESSEIETLIVEKLDDLPIPDYHDYFIELCQTKIQESFTPVLLMESSRGCWKGEKQPCTFCGLNGNRCRYRVKNNARVLDEFKNLSKTYKVNSFIMTDTILNMNYFQNLFKTLEQQPYTLFFETTSNLTEKQLKMLSTAGVNWIQPGIESLHDELLALLNKGNSAIHNIALLKYALENGVAISWNFLYCIPGDQESYYKEMIELLPLLYHLQPPSFAQVRFDRFSVYHENPTQYNLSLKPVKAYEYVTPFKADELSSFAYYFHDDSIHDRKTKLLPVLEPLGKIINRWIVLFHNRYVDIETPQLQITEENGKILLRDTRPCARSAAYRLDTLETAIYKASRHPVKKRDLFENILQDGSFDESAINQCLDRLLNNKLVINVNDTFLALANYPPTKKVVSAFNANDMLTRPDAMKTLKKVERQLTINDWFKTLKI